MNFIKYIKNISEKARGICPVIYMMVYIMRSGKMVADTKSYIKNRGDVEGVVLYSKELTKFQELEKVL